MIKPASFLPRIALPTVAIYLSIVATAFALAATSSPWAASTNSKSRLISGTVDVDGKPELLAGVQLRMDPGWKTYWHYPGDSGVPPEFDWSGSTNVRSVEVLYPAPHRFADGSGTAIGYSQDVVFPVRVTPEQAGQPVELKLAFAFGLCMDLCIPNQVDLALTLPAGAPESPGDSILLANALAEVPKPTGPETVPRIVAVDAALDGPEPHLKVEALFDPKATETDLFIAAGRVFVPVPKPLGAPVAGKQSFMVPFGSPKEAAALKGKTLTLTLVSAQGASQTDWLAK